MIVGIKKEPCKKVPTIDVATKEINGSLIELYKDEDKTVAYLTTAKPGAFKGYHLHKLRQSHYVCIKGKMKITVVKDSEKEEYILDSQTQERLLIPTNVYIGLENIGEEEAWLINYPSPSYNPDLKDEQVDKTREEIEGK